MAHSFRFIDLLATAALLLGAALLAGFLSGEGTLSGYARAVDGDTLELLGERVRLKGLDAPELHQACGGDRRDAAVAASWPCGRAARDALQGLLQQGIVACTFRARDRFGRPLAHCTADGRDMGEALVREGWAIAYGDWAYEAPEVEARRARRGIWAGTFETPRDYRAAHPR